MKNQAIPKYQASEVILEYGPTIEDDIDHLMGVVLTDGDFVTRAMRVTKFLNAVLCNGGVVPIEDSMDGYHFVPCKWDNCNEDSRVKHHHQPDVPVCHHSDDEWVFNPCPACPKDQREAINAQV